MSGRAEYAALDRHGVIGDLHTAALVDDTGTVSWYCAPAFDSPSVFASLLDAERGGLWRVGPVSGAPGTIRYIDDTNVLETRHDVGDGVTLTVTDFMPVAGARTRFSEIHRVIACVGGAADVAIRFDPRFNYGTRSISWQRRGSGWLATDDDDDVVTLAAPPSIEWVVSDAGLAGRLTLRHRDAVTLVLRFDDDEVHRLDDYDSGRRLIDTIAWWREWAARARYVGPHTREVRRSLLALKLCCYEPTGATVAAPTTSLPEVPGGARNWDYRFMWLRDSAFVLFALDRSGYTDEVDAFTHFVKRLCRRADGPHVQTMYRIDGNRELPEIELEHLDGYGGAKPVRIGNAAAHQYQLDVYGELLEIIYARHRRTPLTEGLWRAVRLLVEWTASQWQAPDWSIWEARQEPRHFVFSKMMAWTALDRGARIADALGHRDDATRWRTHAAAVRDDVFARGWDAERGAFVQAYGARELDAAVLVAGRIGFVERDDPRFRTTIAAVRRELGTQHEELVYRYRRPDGLPGTEGAFVICSFWVVQALAVSGELDEAERLFGKLLARATPLGLYGEAIDPDTGAHLGNFPQAFSHAAVINTAHVLARERAKARDRAPGPDSEPVKSAATPAPEPERAASAADTES